jgi:hypothetical protein
MAASSPPSPLSSNKSASYASLASPSTPLPGMESTNGDADAKLADLKSLWTLDNGVRSQSFMTKPATR